MNYRIGLDIGITSIGWATLHVDEQGNTYRIGNLGVRIFDKPENPKNGESLAKPRRDARGARRTLRRRRHRLERIKELIQNQGVMSVESINNIYNLNRKLVDIYLIRYKALDEKISNEELTRLLIHLSKRRGFKSNRKSEVSDTKSEGGKLLKAVKANQTLLKTKKYRTIGEMLFLDEKYTKIKRNKQDDYSHTVSRDMMIDEIKYIFAKQRELNNAYCTSEFENLYLEIFEGQRDFDKGPACGPYSGNQIEKMLGKCTFEPMLPRAVKASYTFERFMLIGKTNNIRVRKTGSGLRILNVEQKKLIISKCYGKNKVIYKDLRKLLMLSEDEYFKGLVYGRKTANDVEKATFVEMKAYHLVRKAIDKYKKGYINDFSPEQLDTIGYALTVYKNDEQISIAMKEADIKEEIISYLLPISFSKTGHLSIKAIKKILPYMEDGLDYDKACEKAGYDFKAHSGHEKTKLLPIFDYSNMTNPLVKRALSQSRKLLNAIIREYGSPEGINIELAREMSKSHEERNKIDKSYQENNAKNERIKNKLINEFKIINPTGSDIVKYKLYEEQDGFCMYSCEKLDLTQLFNPGYVDVDHIVPYSLTFNDSYLNKVLVKAYENRQKGNRLPYEYLSSNEEKLKIFIELVASIKTIPLRKRQLLLKQKLSQEEIDDFKDRNLNDTRYINRELANHIKKYLSFAATDYKKKKKVISVNGRVTSYMRKRWGLTKSRSEGDLHHALDAVVIACVDDTVIKRISNYHKNKELFFQKYQKYIDLDTGEIINSNEYDKKYLKNSNKFPEPWNFFRKELLARLSKTPKQDVIGGRVPNYYSNEEINPIFVSRAPRRKISGAGHKETIKSPKEIEQGYVIQKKLLKDLKLKDGEISHYYKPETDLLLYNALKTQLIKYNGDGKEAFKQPFFKPKSDATSGPIVKKVKIMDKSTINVLVNSGKGVADNGGMIRIDIFEKENKYYFVPVYIADAIKGVLPNKASIAAKPYSEWPIMDENYKFKFSLYPNDLFYFKHKKGIDLKTQDGIKKISNGYFYYKKAGISTATITISNHDNSLILSSLGIKTLLEFKKYHVDYLGNISLVEKEERMGFSAKR